ncbi:DUF998 domain-containing protein [Neptunomonas sp.]|uniref:DUF998 domain-containing protein n=1 Tax=Neptunomonas sp. TaxID=1971898 RepID=UPI0025FFC32F|nr:DUF998 domain-containing protein [Neptunomonas sp.]
MKSTGALPPTIDHHTSRLIVGLIAISLAPLTNILSLEVQLDSISASYHEGGWARDIFVGFLFAISAFLLSYNGESKTEAILSKVAAVSALGVALFPCTCGGDHDLLLPSVHYISAAIMFLILAYFCLCFYTKALSKGHSEAKIRAFIYGVCGALIILSIAVLAIDSMSDGSISKLTPRLTFVLENIGLTAFGIAWLTASRMFPFITSEEERLTIKLTSG